MHARSICLLIGFVVGSVVTGLIATEFSDPRLPQDKLVAAATKYRYLHDSSWVLVPPGVIPAEKLREWRKYSENRGLSVDAHHFHPAMEGKVYQLRVHFNKTGTRIESVTIEWWREDKSWGFPYRLDEEETQTFVHKAIYLMAEAKAKR